MQNIVTYGKIPSADPDRDTAASDHTALMTSAVLRSMRAGVLTVDRTGTITTINPQAANILSLDEASCVGERFGTTIFDRNDLDHVGDLFLAAISDPENTHSAEFEIGAERVRRNVAIRTSAFLDPVSGTTNGIVAIINDITDQVRSLRDRIEFGYLTIFSVVFLSLTDVVGVALGPFNQDQLERLTINWSYVLMMLVPLFYLRHRFKRPLGDLGITTRNLSWSLKEGAGLGIILVAAIFFSVALIRYAKGSSGFNVLPALALKTSDYFYFPHSVLQELLARGFLQGSFKRFLNDKTGYLSIFIASIVFGSFHSHYGILTMGVTFLSGLIFGWLYNRHDNLAGVSLSHFMGGVAIFGFGLID